MSGTDDTTGSPADPTHKVRFITINLAELLGRQAAPKLSHLELTAAALASITVIKAAAETHPERAQTLLKMHWGQVELSVMRGQGAGCEIDAAVIGEYFRHAGDWGAMRQCLISTGEALQKAPGEFHTKYEEMLAKGRGEFEKLFGAAAT